ncbi:HEAT repeat domain-containing protein [Kitasatospora sp. NPDC059408]|uniref:HEAT repeat domain-containing protein n=1 Tax=Kitasatospora sp. NPDC059408 TaxID=3346823 RepID=UPI0036BD15CE
MAMFVHLTSTADAPRVRRAGIRADSRGQGGARGVYCFPVLPSYTLTHQWLRELARFGRPGGLVAVHVRLPDDEPVLAGHYRDRAKDAQLPMTAAEAVHRIRALPDPRGWEVFLSRAVASREIHRIRTAPQVTGWRYVPNAHGTRPCTCYGCRVLGGYGSRRLRERNPHPLDGPPPPARVLLARIDAAGTPGDPARLRDTLHWFSLRRRGPVERVAHLADHPAPEVRQALVQALNAWSTPGARELVTTLAADPHPDVREAVAWAAYNWTTPGTRELLTTLAADPHPDVRAAAEAALED